jgi:hypothetical protein
MDCIADHRRERIQPRARVNIYHKIFILYTAHNVTLFVYAWKYLRSASTDFSARLMKELICFHVLKRSGAVNRLNVELKPTLQRFPHSPGF